MSTGAPTSPARYVLTISAGSEESLAAHAHDLAAFLSGGSRPERRLFAHATTLPAVAVTLLNFRRSATHRLAFTAATVQEAADRLTAFTENASEPQFLAPQGLYANVVRHNVFTGEAEDREYLLALAANARHEQLAKLWSAGFPIDWRPVYPALAGVRPVYLPPTPLNRRRHWPRPAPQEAVAPQEVIQPPREAVAVQPPQPAAPPDDGFAAELAGLPVALRVRRLSGYLQGRIAPLLGYPEGELPRTDLGFFDLGMSSIHLGQVRQAIVEDTGFEPGETSAFDHPTIAGFASYLAQELAGPRPAPQPALLHTLSQDDIDRLSVHDLERALVEATS
ncbi:Phosphopantetheine attachment site [Lentzea fradiae]|uniref:Phosphopantetheine attachment site n=1 Tax=Lentzea fradiae TaxID=200378 RepID=A0A1G7XI23_9PSEU|nr:acyl carrier protein [Lentzea fradiae]SDG83751.1 Phosphopantetheine attachment site [Lentzea fradiae]